MTGDFFFRDRDKQTAHISLGFCVRPHGELSRPQDWVGAGEAMANAQPTRCTGHDPVLPKPRIPGRRPVARVGLEVLDMLGRWRGWSLGRVGRVLRLESVSQVSRASRVFSLFGRTAAIRASARGGGRGVSLLN